VVLVCTWGAQGAAAVKLLETPRKQEWAKSEAWHPSEDPQAEVIDTIGAGDTFIAGMLFGLANSPNSTLEEKLQYAVQIASRKVYQDGFQGLGEAMEKPCGVK
jgi:ketohexokinase